MWLHFLLGLQPEVTGKTLKKLCVAVLFQKYMFFSNQRWIVMVTTWTGLQSMAWKIQGSFQLVVYTCIISTVVRQKILLDGAQNGGSVEFHLSGMYYWHYLQSPSIFTFGDFWAAAVKAVHVCINQDTWLNFERGKKSLTQEDRLLHT